MSKLKQSPCVGHHAQTAVGKADVLGMFGCNISLRLPLQQPLGSQVMNNEILLMPRKHDICKSHHLFSPEKIPHYSSLTHFVFRWESGYLSGSPQRVYNGQNITILHK